MRRLSCVELGRIETKDAAGRRKPEVVAIVLRD